MSMSRFCYILAAIDECVTNIERHSPSPLLLYNLCRSRVAPNRVFNPRIHTGYVKCIINTSSLPVANMIIRFMNIYYRFVIKTNN